MSQQQPRICYITAIFGNYEFSCKQYAPQSVPADFICFTENVNIIPNGWTIDTTPYHVLNPNPQDNGSYRNSLCNNKHTFNIAKYYKTSFQCIPRLKDYDVVVWLDGTIEITDEHTSEYVLNNINDKKIIGWIHDREGLLRGEVEGSHTIRYTNHYWHGQHQPYQNVDEQYYEYLADGFDDFFCQKITPRPYYGVWLTCFVAFLNKDPDVKQFLDHWSFQIMRYTTQDQISFPYVAWKTGLIPYTLPDDQIHGYPAIKTQFYIKHDHGK